jgi:hypothetical protein
MIDSRWVSFVLVVSACVPEPVFIPVRVSSVQQVPQSDFTYPKPPEDVTAIVQQSFKARGFPVVDQRQITPSVRYYVFQGARQQVTSTKGYVGRYGGTITSENYVIGSWFVVRIEGSGTSTNVFIMGKPTVNNTAVCSKADARLKESDYFCSDTKIQEGAPEWSLVTGKEEADTVKGVIIELEQAMAK